MANAVIVGSGGGGTTSSDVTATKANVLSGKTTVTSDSNDEVVSGTMTNNGSVSATLAINGTYTIPQGYHDGTGTVKQSISTLGATTYYATTSNQTIASGKYLSGTQTISKLTQTNLSAANIKPGVVVSVNNGKDNVWSVTGAMSSLAAKTYYATTSDQTISSGVYLSGDQTIKAISQENLVASNIKKGVTVYVKNGNGNVYSVTGTWEGYVASTDQLYNNGVWGSYGQATNQGYRVGITEDSGQLTFNGNYYSSSGICDCLVFPTAINMAKYTKLTISGSVNFFSSGASGYAQTTTLKVCLYSSIPTSVSYVNDGGAYMVLATKSTSEHSTTWGDFTLSWTAQNVTKYLGIYLSQVTSASYAGATGKWTKITLS